MVYHYTTIETFEKIVMNKTIRLNRLDFVDDKTEAEAFKGIKFAKYIFVSSWTKKKEEDLYQWKEYGNNFQGVRIGLPEHMFKLKHVSPAMYKDGKYNGIKLSGEGNLILLPEEVFTNTYEVLPMFPNWNSFRLEVTYVDDVFAIKNEMEKIIKNKKAMQIILENNWLQKAAGIKNRIWSQQEEIRFVLFIFPSLPKPSNGYDNPFFNSENIKYKTNCILAGVPPSINYIDLSLDVKLLNNIDITVGANCSKIDREGLIKIASDYCKNALIKDSTLKGQIRPRNT
ncbi:MAG TPA: hypothetical protein DCL73_08765 [Treponema sp.]|nr:hypothetical protein [Treponema sp.]